MAEALPRIIGPDAGGNLVALICEQPDFGGDERLGRVVARLGGVGVVGSFDEEPGLNVWQYQLGPDRLRCGWSYGEFYAVGPAAVVHRVLAELTVADAEPGAAADPRPTG